MPPATVAVDAMGGDHAPDEIVTGALAAARDGARVLLCGPEAALRAALPADGGIEVVDAPETIASGDDAVAAVRARPRSSLVTACRLVAEGRAGAAVSAGSTGAMLAASLRELRRVPGVQRPAIAAVLPGQRGPCVLIDAGANADARPSHLAQFALMGAVFAEEVLGLPRPRVGLLSIGEEASKGNALTLAARPLIEELDLNFAGNCEGRDVLRGDIPVVVADGFTGNVLLKGLEGTAAVVFDELRQAATSGGRARAGALLLRPALRRVRARMQPDTYGGAYLLGVRGVAVVAHGSSRGRAVANAIAYAARGAEAGVVRRLAERLAASPSARDLQDGGPAHTVPPVSSPDTGDHAQ